MITPIYAVKGTGLLRLRPLLLGPYDTSKSDARRSSFFLGPNDRTLWHRPWKMSKRARSYFNFEKCQCFARLLRKNVILRALWPKDVNTKKMFHTHVHSSSCYFAALSSISVFLHISVFCCGIMKYFRIGSSLNWRSATALSVNGSSRERCRWCCKTKLIMILSSARNSDD